MALALAPSPAAARGSLTERLSVDSDGAEVSGASAAPSMSSTGRYVAFSSAASDLVAGDTNGTMDVFVHDQTTGTTTRVSVADGGDAQADGDSDQASISPDGRFVAFRSTATNLTEDTDNGFAQIYLRDLLTQQTRLLSINGTAPGNGASSAPAASQDGATVAFVSAATNFVLDGNGVEDVYRYRFGTTVTRVSAGNGGLTEANGASGEPSISPDGRYIAFSSVASNMTATDANTLSDVFVRDGQTADIERASVRNTSGLPATSSSAPSISDDGRFVAFTAEGSLLLDEDLNDNADVYLRDRTEELTSLVSLSSAAAQGDGNSFAPSLSGDGRRVAFTSSSTNLVTSDANLHADVFVRDVSTATTRRTSVGNGNVEGDLDSSEPSISDDAAFVAFASDATTFDGDANHVGDVYGRVVAPARPTDLATSPASPSDDNTPHVSGSAGDDTVQLYSDDSCTTPVGSPGLADDFAAPGFKVTVADGTTTQFYAAATLSTGFESLCSAGVSYEHLASTTRASINAAGGGGDDTSDHPSVSDDGRYVAFSSYATNLVPGDTNGRADIFVRDRQLGTIERVNLADGGPDQALNGDSSEPAISAGGRYVAFVSGAANLGATNAADVIVRDRETLATYRVSVAWDGQAAAGNSTSPSISANGGQVAFRSTASLGPGDDNGQTDVYLRDIGAAQTIRVSASPDASPVTGESYAPAISADGQFVAFASAADNVAPIGLDTSPHTDVFVWSRTTGEAELASVADDGAQADADSGQQVSISGDGRFVAFSTAATNLGGSANGTSQIYLRDRTADTTAAVQPGAPDPDNGSQQPVVSADGRRVAYVSFASTIVADDNNHNADVFVWDRASQATKRVSVSSAGAEGASDSFDPALSGDGRYAAFASLATNLVAHDTTNTSDVYVREVAPGPPTGLGVSPARANDNAPRVTGTPRAGATVRIYKTTDCSGAAEDGTAAAFASPGLAVTVADDSTTEFHATQSDAEGFSSSCSADSATFVEDSTPPAAPTALSTSPHGPANFNDPKVQGTAAAGSTVKVYANGACLGPATTSGTADDFGNPGLTATVPDDSDTTFHATATDEYGNESACSTSSVTYVEDSHADPPVLTGSSPSSPANENAPRITGTTESSATVRLYRDAGCTGALAGAGRASASGTAGVLVAVADGSTTTFYGTATDRAGNLSGCSPVGVEYVENSALPAQVYPGHTSRINVTSDEAQVAGSTQGVSVSADGRFVAFDSDAVFDDGDTHGFFDIFVRDRQLGTTERVSVSGAGAEGDSASFSPSISADGRYVAFASQATNLVAGDTNNAPDIFVHDRQLGTTQRVSVDSEGTQANGFSSDRPSISADGRYVAFGSLATNLVPLDTNGQADVFVRDRLLNLTRGISTGAVGPEGYGNSDQPAISADGQVVAFRSSASNLVVGDGNGAGDVFLWTAGAVRRVSVANDETEIAGASDQPALSADGGTVAFTTTADLDASDTNHGDDVYVRNLDAATTVWAGVGTSGSESGHSTVAPSLDGTGRRVAFNSDASNLVDGDDNDDDDAFVRDLARQKTTRVSVQNDGGQTQGGASDLSFAASGRLVAFRSFAADLVPDDTNGTPDIFARELPDDPPVVTSEPVSPANENDPHIVGSAEAGATVRLYNSDDCTGQPFVFSAADFAATGFPLTVPDDTSSFWSARQIDAGDNESACSAPYTYVEDSTAPAAPSGLHNAGGSPANDNGPEIQGTAEAHSTVTLYADASCGGSPVTTGAAADFGSPGLTVTVTDDTTTSFTATATDEAGNTSACSAPLVYTEDSAPPAAPSGLQTSPASPANDRTPKLRGTAEAGSTVLIYRAGDCGGTRVASGTAAVFATPGFIVAAAADAETTFTATATDTSGNTSACSAPLAYTDDSDLPASLTAGRTTLLSVDSAGVHGNADSLGPSASADGRYVTFVSDATNLVAGDGNDTQDVFVRDAQTGVTSRVSEAGGGNADGPSFEPAISDDGRAVVFTSTATNLHNEDINGSIADVFIRNLDSGQVAIMSTSFANVHGNADSGGAAISGDGSQVAFDSLATNLVPGDDGENGFRDVFVKSRFTGAFERVSVDSAEVAANGASKGASLSENGRFVAFRSDASNLVAGDDNHATDVFVRDRLLGTTVRVSGAADESTTGGGGTSPSISGDGRFVAFSSAASDVVPDDGNDHDDVFVRDLQTETTERVSGEAGGFEPSISGDGRRIAFTSLDAEDKADVFVADRGSGAIERLSADTAGIEGDQDSGGAAISADGRHVAFSSYAENLVPEDLNDSGDVFLREIAPATPRDLDTVPHATGNNNTPLITGIADPGVTVRVYANADCTGTPAVSGSAADLAAPGLEVEVADNSTTTWHVTTTTSDGFASGCSSDALTYIEDSIAPEGPTFAQVLPRSPANENDPAFSGTVAHAADLTIGVYASSDCSGSPVASGSGLDFTGAGIQFHVEDDTSSDFSVLATDAAGNSAPCGGSIYYVEDSTPPDTPTITASTPESPAGENFPKLKGTTDAGTMVVRIYDDDSCSRGGTLLSRGTQEAFTGHGLLVAVPDDTTRTFYAEAVDEAGNASDCSAGFTYEQDSSLPAPAANGHTARLSVASDGTEGDGESHQPAASADGRYVAFASAASTLVPGDTNNASDVLVRDRQTGSTERVSLSDGDAQATGASAEPAISGDGRFVAFASTAANLVTGDSNSVSDVYVRDREDGSTERVSVATGGAQGIGASTAPAISADGRFVAFASAAANLVGDDSNSAVDVFVRDREDGTTERVSVATGGAQGIGGASTAPAISADGGVVAFTSTATNLVGDDTNGAADVFVRNLGASTTERVSVSSAEAEAPGASGEASISADGHYVAFTSAAPDIVPGATSASTNVYLRDRDDGDTTRVSSNLEGNQGELDSSLPAISPNGRFVAFTSEAPNLVLGDGIVADVFVWSRVTQRIDRVSVDTTGVGADGASPGRPALSADGRFVAFFSLATNLVAGDLNDAGDVFGGDLAPEVPRDLFTTPSSPANGNAPKVRGTAEAGATVRVYATPDCSGAPEATGSAEDFGSPGLAATVTDDTTTSFRATATDAAGNLSPCSSDAAVYVEDSTAPPAPTALRTPSGRANNNNPLVAGDPGDRFTTVRVYPTADCSGPVGGSGSWVQLLNEEISVEVADDTTTTFHATNTDEAGNTSVCSTVSFTYTEDSTANPPSITGSAPGSPANDNAPKLIGTAEAGSFVRLYRTADCSGQPVGEGTAGRFASSGLIVSAADNSTTTFHALITDPSGNVSACSAGRTYVEDSSLAAPAGARELLRSSVSSAGDEGADGGGDPAVNTTGRYVAFVSESDNLVAGDTEGYQDVFVRDRRSGTTTRASVTNGGAQSDNRSFEDAISGDGRYVAFGSTATNLVAGDTNGQADVFVRDRQAQTTTRVSVPAAGGQSMGESYESSISADGRYVTFSSEAPDLVAVDTNGESDVFLRDRQAGTTVRISSAAGGGPAHGASYTSVISPDGRYVAFISEASDVVAGDTNDAGDIFLWDRVTGTTVRASVTPDGAQLDASSGEPDVSADGARVAYSSPASNLPDAVDGVTGVFVWTRATGAVANAGRTLGGAPANGDSSSPSISDDGARVAFGSSASNLVAGDTNDSPDVFVRDLDPGTTQRVSLDADGTEGFERSRAPAIAGSGHRVTFASDADNLVPGDLNESTDVFLRALQILDSAGPATPAAPALTPSSPANNNTPKLTGVAEAGSTVAVYAGANCGGDAMATGTAAGFAAPGIAVSVADDTSTTFRVIATDGDGDESGCSAGAEYVEDSTAPAAPVISATVPGSPANDNSPKVSGTAAAGSTVKLFTAAGCAGASAATGTAAGFATPGIAVSVPGDAATTLTATATDAAGNVSGCSAAATYVEDSTAPAAPAISGGPADTTTATDASFAFSGESGGTFECRLDGGSFAGCVSPKTYSGLGTGPHEVAVRQTDAAGNTGAATTRAWTVTGASPPPPPPVDDGLPVAKDDSLTVDCELPDGPVETCHVDLFLAADSGARAAARVLIGSGDGTAARGQRTIAVRVVLTKRGKVALAAHPEGLSVSIDREMKPFDSTTTTKTTEERVLMAAVLRLLPGVKQFKAGEFATGKARLGTPVLRYLRNVKTLVSATARVRCEGFTDNRDGARREAARKRLSRSRARAVCAQLKKLGLTKRTTAVGFGSKRPRATNRTARGRALNRRVEIVITR